MLSYALIPASDGILLMVSQSDCCQVTGGSGVMSQGCSINPWTASSSPPAVGNGKVTGTWMKTLKANPQRKRWVTSNCFFSHFPPFWIFCLFNIHIHVCRDGATQSTSLLRTTKTRSGTPVSVAGDGSATGGIKPWIPGLRCVLSSLSVHILCAFMCVQGVTPIPIPMSLSPSKSWQIPSQHVTLPDPFSDISCGGWEISEEPRGRLSLWAVSLQGKVYIRLRTNPSVYIQAGVVAKYRKPLFLLLENFFECGWSNSLGVV